MSNLALDQSVGKILMLEAALELAARGFPVFPLQPRSKEPYKGSRGLGDATLEAAVIRAWWERAPESNVGLRPPPGVLVVDPDPRNGGFASLAALEAAGKSLPETLTVRTGRGDGGIHAYYRVPAELVSWPKEAAPGIDLKGPSGYVLAPPSLHDVSGLPYVWEDLRPMADAPAWLVELGRQRTEHTEVVDEDEGEAQPEAVIAAAVAQLEPLFVAGSKHEIAFALGGWFRQRGWTSADAVRVVEQLPSDNPRARAKDVRDGYRANQGWHALRTAIGDAAAAALDAATPNPKREREAADLDAVRALIPPAPASAQQPAALLPPPLRPGAGLPELVADARGSQFWMLRGLDYFAPVAKSMLPARAKEAGKRGPINDKGIEGKHRADDLAAEATIAEKVVRDFGATGITWQVTERAIVHGYQQPQIAPVYDVQVDAWLRELTGGRYDYLAQWFATCTQARIQKLAACLVLIGGTGIGKTLIALLAARMWGASSPVPLAHAIDRFNSTITKCPIVLDDEAARMKQGDVATNDFREMLSARERTYEPKGVDKRELRGCQRFVITCNAFSDLRFSDVGALEVVEALADRLLVVPCGPADAVRAALQPLRLPGTDDVDLARLDGHVAWLVANTTVTTARFLASPGRDDAAARQAVLDGLVQQHPDLFDEVRHAIERGEHTAPVEPPAAFVHGGAVWVRGDRASGRLDARDVFRALAPWELAPRRNLVRVGGSVVRARAYDLGRLAAEAVTPVTQVTPDPHSPQIP